MNDNIKDLYNELKKSYELGSEEEFRQYLSNENNREALRKELEAEYDVGDSASFSSYLGFNGGQAKAKTRGTYAPQAFLLPSQGEGKAPVARPKTSQQPVVAQPSKPAAQPKTSQPKVSNPYKQSNPVTATYEVGEPTKKAIRQDVATMASPEFREKDKIMREEQADFEKRLAGVLNTIDPDNAAEAAWANAIAQEQEDITSAAKQAYGSGSDSWARSLGMGSSMTGGFGQSAQFLLDAQVAKLKARDLEKMADDAWASLGHDKQVAMIEEVYKNLQARFPDADEKVLEGAAFEMARQQSDRRMYELAVSMNAPKNATEYFFRKALQSNMLTMLSDAAARKVAGTTGDWAARDVAEQRFEKESGWNKVAGIGGTVAGMAIDPTMWMSAGVGSAAAKGTMWLGGKMAARKATETAGRLLQSRLAQGAVAGAANFGTFEGAGETLNQLRLGGALEGIDESGNYVIGDYSGGKIAGQVAHGLGMGAVTGVVGGAIGNVSDRVVRATKPTAGKIGERVAQGGVSTVAEGTIFAAPEMISTAREYNKAIAALSDPNSPSYIENERERSKAIAALREEKGAAITDVWTDNQAMILGFKLHGLAKTGGKFTTTTVADRIAKLRGERGVREGFETRLRRALDGQPGLQLTNDEREELKRWGYTDLDRLAEEAKAYKKQQGSEATEETMPYERFAELMGDKRVSEAARAKMYYYLTGNQLPMSTVMGGRMEEEVGSDGNGTGRYLVQSIGANGVITSKVYGNKAEAEGEMGRIERQMELNGIDVGEKYREARADRMRMEEACELYAEANDIPSTGLYEMMRLNPETMSEGQRKWAAEIQEVYEKLGDSYSPADIRREIEGKYGVSIDKAIAKEPNRRSEKEQQALDTYMKRLYEGVEQPKSTYAYPDEPNKMIGDRAVQAGYTDEQGRADFGRGYNADGQERRDIYMEEKMEGGKEASIAGVERAIEDQADFMAAQEREQYREMTQADGSLHPAELKGEDEDGNKRQVYIIDESEGSVVVYDPTSGKKEMMAPGDIAERGEVESAEQIESGIEQRRNERVQKWTAEARGEVNVEPGETIDLGDGRKARVLATDAESITIQTEDGVQQTVSREEVQKIADQLAVADYEARHPREAEPLPVDEVESGQPEVVGESLPEGYEAGEPERYEEGMEVLMTVDGEVKPVTIGQRVSLVDREFVYNPEGKIIEYTVEGESEPRHIQEKAMADEVVGYKPMEEREEVASGPEEAEVPTEEEPVEETAEERAVSTYNGMVERYGEKTGHKIEVTLKDREEELEKKRAALEKAQKAFDEAPVGKEEEAEAAEEKAQEEYDVAKAERDEWARIKEVYDRNNEVEEEVVEQPRESVEESQQTEEQPINNNEDEQYIKDQDTVDSEGGLVDSEVVRQSVPTHWREVLHGLGRHIGRRVSVLDGEAFARRTGNRRVRGEYNPEDNTIYLNADYVGNDEQMMSFVFGHELTHSLRDENPELWDSFVGFVKGAMGEEFDKQKAELRERYDRAIDMMNSRLPEGRRKYKKLSDAAIEEEVCADWAGDHMLTDEDAVKQILEEAEEVGADATTLIRRVLDWINGIVEKLKSLGKPADYAEKARDLWQQMYNVAVARNNAKAEAKVDLNLEGIDVDENKGDARMALADILEGEERDKEIRDLMEVTGRDRKTVERWMESEQSLAKIIMDGDNAAILEREIDESVPSIWKNSDYPQGTVEFSNICRKRLPFTTVYSKLQKEFPNTVFNAEALETIRQTMKQNGHDVACGLCFVEDRRQLLGEIGQQFIEGLQGKPFRPIGEGGKEEMNQKQTAIIEGLKKSGDNYVPDLFELLTVEGMKQLRRSHPGVANAFIEYNNARGMQAGRLFQAYSAYHREILGYSPAKVKKINDNGGLRIFSFSDFEAPHLMDLVQVLADCAAKGIKVQGYTKVPEFAKAVKDTKAKVNRSLIAKGVGYVDADYQPKQREAVSSNVIDGKRLLFDLVEGIDVTNPNFFDSSDNENIGNILVGINDEQIRMAMADPFVDYIIPFHTGLKEKIRIKKGIGDWVNYQNSQLEKKVNDRGNLVNADKHGINIYTDVLQRSEELIGHEVRNVRDFQEAFLKAVAEKGWIPRFSQFLDRNEEGEYVYTPGYEKFLVDFKMFDKEGNILPQEAVVPEFDDDFNKEILDDYVEGEKSRVPYDDLYNKVKESLGLGEESDVRFSFGDGGTRRKRTVNGLNRGYTTRDDGTAISVRAEDAEDNGKYTEGRFRTNYGVAKRDFEVLKDLGLIESNEWHHTGRSYNKSDFYEWGDHHKRKWTDGAYSAENQTPEGSLAARYQEKKKEIGKLAKEYEEAQWEWESLRKKYDNIPTYENYRGDKVRGNTDWLLTPEERERKEKEHEFISTVQKDMGMSAFERKEEHENVDRKYREIAASHVDDEQLRKEYEERYGEEIAFNERADAENEEIRKRNAKKRGKEKIMEEIGQMMGMSEEEARKKAEYYSAVYRKREKAEELARLESGVREYYTKRRNEIIKKGEAKRAKFIEKCITEGKAHNVTRSKEKPDIVEKEEMNGKYGWFEASSRYNLPVYYSGIKFDNEKDYERYRKINLSVPYALDENTEEEEAKLKDIRYAKAVEEGDGYSYRNMLSLEAVLKRVKEDLEPRYGEDGELIPLSRHYEGDNDVRFSVDDKKEEREEKTLMGVHNISEEKLKKAIKNGGLANPSMAVVDTKNGTLSSYGEISLIPKASLIDSRTGRNAGTYAGDAYTPVYPNVEFYEGKETEKRLEEITKGLPEGLAEYIRRRVTNYVDKNASTSGLEYVFLKERGQEMPIVRNERQYPNISKKEIAERIGADETEYGSTLYDEYKKLPEDKRYDFNLWLSKNGNEEEIRKVNEMVAELREEGHDEAADQLAEIYRKPMTFARFDTLVYNVSQDERRAGEENLARTLEDAAIAIDKQGLRNEFEAWKEKKIDELGYEERLFAGYTPAGNRRYLPNTVENASKLMNRQSDTNSYNDTGLNATRAAVMYKMRSLDDIRKHKDLLKGNEAYGKQMEEMTDRLLDIAHELSDMQKIDDNPFLNTDYAVLRLQEAMAERNPIAHLNKEYGYDIDEKDDLAKEIKSFIKDVKDMPAKYFETKFKRPVKLDEFDVAVVPDNVSEEVKQSLEAAGLNVVEYEHDNEESRREATLGAVRGRDDIRFSVGDEPMFSVPADIEEEGASRFSLVEDEKEIERLESEPKERGYRTVVLNEDGTLGSPMAGKLGSRGKTSRATSGFRFGAWEQAEENPDLADENGKIDLKKPTGKTVAKVNYNPYVHIRPTMLNKQFKEAWERPNLVYVETEYPASELDGGYKAEKAALSVGKHRWQGDYLILSRWDKPMRVMPWEEVADVWAEEFKDKGVNFDIVPPQMRDMLEERGVEILPPHKGMSKECNEAYEEWKAEREQPAEPIARQSVSEVLGEDYGKAMEEVYSKMAEQDRRAIDEQAGRAFLEDTTKDYEGEREKAVGEALEALADKDFEDFSEAEQTMWEEARRAINEATGMDLTDAEMRYMLWRGAEGIESGKESPADVLRDMAKREELGLDEQPRFSVAAPNNTPPKVAARESYERMMASAVNQFKEATQDSMLSLKKLYEAIMGGKKFKIEDVPGYENAYLAENRMQSASQAQIDAWQTGYIRPIEKAVSDLCSEGKGVKHFSKKKYDELTDYMMAKHGLERNEVMAKRDAQEAAKNGANYQDAYEANRMKDYAGLTALTGKKDVAEAETEAQRMVDEYEASHNVDELWKAVNNATLFSLLKLQKSGLISKERFDQIRQMYQYYIPLQGFDEKVAENVYAYLGSDGTLGYGTPIKTAKGRKSKADDPIATISMNGEATIRKGNRNEMKKAFLAFVQNHPSDLVSVSDVWLRKNAKGEWEQYFDADLKETDTPEEVERKLVDFEKRMEAEQQQHPNEYKRSSELPDVPFRVVENRDMKQHQVMVQSGGKTYVLTINGNPRAAQALNGMTNPDVFTEGVFGKAMNAGQALNRQLSLFYTTRNPEFTVSNFIRDMLYSNSMTWVKESPNYAKRFNRNFVKMNPAHMGVLFAEWESGKLKEKVNSGKASEVEKHFYDFMLEGGETGWTNLKDIEQHKKDLEKSLRREHDINAKTWKAIGGLFDLMNRSVENCARFAAYLTSREMGRSVERSIWDAKEVSVNFNKKGAGDKFLNSQNQKLLGKIGSGISGLGRGMYVFWNAGVQGLSNIMRAAGRHPGKAAIAVLAPQYILGMLAPIAAALIGDDGDDDKNSYYNLPEYVRRSNFCFRFSKNMPWITIPLPIEFRAIYGLGELTTGVLTGKERYTPEEMTKQYISQISQILPIDFMEGGGGFHAFIPSMLKPMVEAYENKGWTGLPIYKKETPWNENNPEWQRAYGSANKQIVDATRWLNEATVREEDVMRAGGNKENLQGVIDWNPARIEYMLKGYFGGYTTMYDRLVKSGETLAGKRDFEWKNVPIASRVIKEGDERTQSRKLRNEYADLVKEYTKTQYQLKQFDEETADPIEKAKRIAYLNYDKKYLHYLIVDEYKTEIDRLRRAAKKVSGEKAADMAEAEEMLKKDMVELIRSIDEKGGLDEIRSNLGEGEAIDESLKEMATERIKPIKGK